MMTVASKKVFPFPKHTQKIHHAISEWMHMVESGEVISCQEQKDLMKYVRKKLDQEDVIIDVEKIEKVIERSEKYFFPLHPFQTFFLSFVVGVYYFFLLKR